MGRRATQLSGALREGGDGDGRRSGARRKPGMKHRYWAARFRRPSPGGGRSFSCIDAYFTAPASIALRAKSRASSALNVSAEVLNKSKRVSPTRTLEPSRRRMDARHLPGSRSKV